MIARAERWADWDPFELAGLLLGIAFYAAFFAHIVSQLQGAFSPRVWMAMWSACAAVCLGPPLVLATLHIDDDFLFGTWLAAYALCGVSLLHVWWSGRVSAATSAVLTAFVLLTPPAFAIVAVMALTESGKPARDDLLAWAAVVATAIYLAALPILQRIMNHLRALPR